MTPSPTVESSEPHGIQPKALSHLAMSPPNPRAARAARKKAVQDKMPDVLAAARHLQRALEIFDSASRPNPLTASTFPQIGVGLVLMNGVRLRASLRMCANFAVDMNRKSENQDFLDRRILLESNATTNTAVEPKTKIAGPHDQGRSHGIEDTPDTVMTDVEDEIPTIKLTAASEHGSPNDFDQADLSPRDTQDVSQINPVGPECGGVKGVPRKFALKASSQPSAVSSSIAVTTDLTMKHPEVQNLSSNSAKSAVIVNHGVKDTIAFENVEVGNTTTIAKVDLKDETSFPIEETIVTAAVENTDLKGNTTSAVTATIVSGENESTPQAGKENPRPSKVWPKFSVPDPTKMPGTFTSAICHQQDINIAPLLTLTLRDTIPPLEYPTTQRSEILLHFEVGLDNVEALCQGTFTVDDSSYWKENMRERCLRKLAKAKADTQGQSKEVEQYQIKKGNGQGCWVFFGVRFQQTGKDKRKGKGGKWACFGVPLESCSAVASNTEVATYGGGCNGEGISVPRYLAKVRRLESLISTGGIACMDLWQNADGWKGGVWTKVKQAMASNALIVSSLRATEEIVTAQMRRAGMTEVNGSNASKSEKEM